MPYIQSLSALSAQPTFEGNLPVQPCHQVDTALHGMDPNYKALLPPASLRRMSRILKMGLSSAAVCVQQSAIKPDAVVVGTGQACIADLEKFLRSIDAEQEHLLSPIPFINSSHNMVAAQIAIMQQIKGYNTTYLNGDAAFADALQDALLLLFAADSRCVLVGGVDEFSQLKFDIFNQLGWWRKQPVDNLQLLTGKPLPGTLFGEGAAFFTLTMNKPAQPIACLQAVDSRLTDAHTVEARSYISQFLQQNNCPPQQVDLLLTGRNGDCRTDGLYEEVRQNFPQAGEAFFKPLCGDYPTCTAFALWLAAQILHQQQLPAYVQLRPAAQLNRILIFNHSCTGYESLLLLTRAD